MLNTEKYLSNIISRLEKIHLKDLSADESKAIEAIKKYLLRQHDTDNSLRLKVTSSEFIVICPICESQDVHVKTVPDKFDDEDSWKIETECNICKKTGYLDSY